jgi:uncharacterized damage-inducible protein DinB
VTDPTLEAAREILGTSLDDMRVAIDGLGPDALNWRPAGDDTNPIAVLAVHAMHSTRWWLSTAIGSPLPERDRPSEFHTTAQDADELLSLCDAMAAECRSLLDGAESLDAGALRPDLDGGEPVTAAWALMHAVEHLREHVAQAQLTRQAWAAKARD